MRVDQLAAYQLLMAQAVGALADHITQSSGYNLTPVPFASLPAPATFGMIAAVTDSTVNTWGSIIAGGGTFPVLAFHNGTNWTVAGK